MFYNVPDSDPLCQSLDAFIHVMEPTKDANGVAWCTGSGYIVRRKALEAIGGWPVGSLAEDVYTSSLLLGCGWRTAYCHEPLQWGTVPDTLIGHLKQRTRWTVGTFQTAIKLNFCLYGKLVRRMSVCARLSAAVFAFDVLFKIFLPIALLTIPVVLSSGGQLVAFTSYSQLRWKIRLCFISLMLNRLNEWISFIPSGYRLAQRDTVAQMWMAPFHGLAIIRGFFLPSWLGGKRLGFLSSGSVKSTLNERDQKSRAPLFWRLKVALWDYSLWMHLAYAIFLLVAVFRSTIHGIVINDNAHSRLMYLFTHAFWPPMLWLLTLTASLVPIRYAVWPPNMPDREELLLRDSKTGVARPREEWKKKRYSKFALWHEMELSVITLYVTVIFLGSCFM
jgi:cellulose synthase/poly-beta-1,6-N-acetylglucosamine synthase-like glycosyltransferase